MRNSLASLVAIALAALFVAPAIVRAQSAETSGPPDGSKLYLYNCLACHQAAGQGMPNMAPALKGNAIVEGDPALLIQILLKGAAAVLPEDRPKFGASTMDSFYYKMNDEEMAAVLNYVRKTFGKGEKTATVNAKEVAAARAKMDAEAAGK
ncbi:MAG: c-type cytochrome [Chthoniobacterales bacterium]